MSTVPGGRNCHGMCGSCLHDVAVGAWGEGVGIVYVGWKNFAMATMGTRRCEGILHRACSRQRGSVMKKSCSNYNWQIRGTVLRCAGPVNIKQQSMLYVSWRKRTASAPRTGSIQMLHFKVERHIPLPRPSPISTLVDISSLNVPDFSFHQDSGIILW